MEEDRTQRHLLHGSTNMHTLGVPFLLFWLIWGHSCAFGGKGRNKKEKKKIESVKKNLASKIFAPFFAFELHKFAMRATAVRPRTSQSGLAVLKFG